MTSHRWLALCRRLRDSGALRSDVAYAAFQSVDRAHFFPPGTSEAEIYADAPSPIGCGVTISAPHMHAWALQHILDGLFPDATQSTLGHGTLTANDRALQSMSLLDVGSGSGFLTAVFGQLFGTVIGIELHPELVELSKRSLAHIQFPPHGTESTGVRIVQGDGKVGYPACAPYDAIHVGAATEDIPAVLIQQLRVGGVMVLPIAPRGHLHSYGRQEWTRLRKVDAHGTCTRQVLLGVHYVPLV